MFLGRTDKERTEEGRESKLPHRGANMSKSTIGDERQQPCIGERVLYAYLSGRVRVREEVW